MMHILSLSLAKQAFSSDPCENIKLLYRIEEQCFMWLNFIRHSIIDYHHADETTIDNLCSQGKITKGEKKSLINVKNTVNTETIDTWKSFESLFIEPPLSETIVNYFLDLLNIVRTAFFLPMLQRGAKFNEDQDENVKLNIKVIEVTEIIEESEAPTHLISIHEIRKILKANGLLNNSFPGELENYEETSCG